MPASDLCSTSDVREFLQKPDGDERQDAIIGSLITRASAAIMRYTEREFAPAIDGETRTFALGRDWANAFVSLAPFDLRSIDSVTLDEDLGSGYTLSAGEYRLSPRPARNGVYTSIFLRPQTSTASGWFSDLRELQIKGDWGFAQVPEDVKHAAIVTTADWFRRDVAAFSTTLLLDQDRLDVPQAFPRGVVPVLDPYRRMTYV